MRSSRTDAWVEAQLVLVDLVAAVENLAEREDIPAAKALLFQGGVGGDDESVLGTLARVKGEIKIMQIF